MLGIPEQRCADLVRLQSAVAPLALRGRRLDPVSKERPSLSVIAAENIRAKRARLRLTQRQAAAKAGVQPSTWSVLESGQRRVTLDDCWWICETLSMTLDDLLDGVPDEARRVLGL